MALGRGASGSYPRGSCGSRRERDPGVSARARNEAGARGKSSTDHVPACHPIDRIRRISPRPSRARDVEEREAIKGVAEREQLDWAVPARAGLGGPHLELDARGMIGGISRATSRAHIARAMIEDLGGRITLDREGDWTVATMVIPLREESLQEAAS